MENTDEKKTPEKPSGRSKNLTMIIVVIILLLVGVVGYMFLGKKSAQQDTASKATGTVPSPTATSVISSIKDALSQSASLACNYTDDQGKTIEAYIKAGAIRTNIEAKTPTESGSVIMKNKKMYYWTGKQGFMMAFDMNEVMSKITPAAGAAKTTGTTQPKPEDFMANLEKFREHCKPAVVADSLFVPPTDVKFSDMSQMMKLNTNPTGAMTQEQIMQMQKQMQDKYQQNTSK